MLNFTNHVKKYPYIIHTEYFNTIYKTRIREWVQRSENKGPFGLLVWNMIPHTHTHLPSAFLYDPLIWSPCIRACCRKSTIRPYCDRHKVLYNFALEWGLIMWNKQDTQKRELLKPKREEPMQMQMPSSHHAMPADATAPEAASKHPPPQLSAQTST